MNEAGDYLNQLTKRKADIRFAQIISRNDDGTYQCRIITSLAEVRAARTNTAEEYAINSWVLLGVPSASGAVLGSMHMILTRAPQEQRGVSGTTPDKTDETFAAAAILEVDPQPLILERGGAAAVQVISGHGFRHPADYGNTGIVIADAPIVTPEEVTMSIQASGDAILGTFDATIDGEIIEDAVTVVASGPAHSLWSLGWDADGVPHVLRVDVADMSVYQDYEITGEYGHVGIAKVGTDVFYRSGFHARRFAMPSGAETVSGDLMYASVDYVQMGAAGGFLFSPLDASSYGFELFGSELATGDFAEVQFGPMPLGAYQGAAMIPDGANLWSLEQSGKLTEWNLAGGVAIRTRSDSELSDNLSRIATDENYLYVMTRTTLLKLNRSDLTTADSVVLGDHLAEIYLHLGVLYVTGDTGGNGFLLPINPATLVNTMAAEIVGHAATDVAFDDVGGFAYVGDFDGGVTKVNLADMTIIARTELYPGAAPGGSKIQNNKLLFT